MSAISGGLLPVSVGRWRRALAAAALMLTGFGAQAQTVSSTSLVASPASSAYGQSVTLTATVAGASPSGSVSFADGGTSLGSGVLNAGVATLTVSSLAVGTHSLTAVYGGDASNTGSTSDAVSLTVAAASTSSTVASSANPASNGNTITFTATVNGQAPTGSVSFSDGSTVIGTSALAGSGNARTASFATAALSTGNHTITVAYAGDANNVASTSAALTQTVNPASTTSSVSSSANPAAYGQSVTWTATVSGLSPGGSVTFKDGSTTLGTATLTTNGNSASAMYTSSALAVGSHSITVVYSGDTNNAASTSAVLTQTINKLSTTTAVSSSTNPSTYPQATTFTATVTGGSSPGGTVTFKDGATVLGTGTLASGVTTYSTGALAAGSHSITAVYGGDANNSASTSPALTQTVNKAVSSVALATSANPSTAGQSVTMTATVTASSPSGTVTFMDGSTTLGAAALVGTSSSLAVKLPGGSHSLTAVYGGDGNNLAATSAAVVQTVNVVSTTVTFSATPTAASLGQNVTLMAKVTGYLPSGTVTFSDGGMAIGSATLTGGAATLSLSSLAQGTHTLNAAYSGDSSNAAVTSSSASVTVNPRAAMTWQYGYDAMGRVNTIVDPNGQATYVYYDSLGRAIQTQQPPNTGSTTPTVTQMAYNLGDGLTSVADPRNLTTSYTPNGLGQVTSEGSPDRGNQQYTYDAKGNLLTSTDARGKTTTYTWDSLDRVSSISYPTGTATTFTYDGAPNPTPAEAGELTKITDESGQTSYVHDAMGRLVSKTVVIGTRTFTVGYAWGDSGSALDKLTAITYPSGNQVNYSYDATGYVSGISVTPVNASGTGPAGSSQTLLSGITYNVDNNPTGWLWSDGKARTIGYDSTGLISSYTLGDPNGSGNAAGLLRSVGRDAAGRITGYTHTNNGAAVSALDQSFAYDSLNRLLTANVAGTNTAYSYDDNGNRTSKTVGGATYSNTIATTSNRLTQTQDVDGTAALAYDAAGHMTSDGTNTFTYNDRGRMTSVTTPGGAVSYLYNGLNQRVSKWGPVSLVPSGAGYFLYDEAGQLLGEYDANGTPVYETVYLGTMPVGALKQTGSAAANDIAVAVYNVYADHIDTPRVITSQDHTIVWRWDTAEAFGGTAPNQDPSSLGAFTFNQRFPGQVFDQESGLNQNWNREYNARTGRYIQSDPIGLEGGINTYGYVGGAPLTSVDPSGLKASDSDSKCTWVGPVLVCQSVPPPNATDPRPASNPLADLFKPSPFLPTWNLDGITWPSWMASTTSDCPPKEVCSKAIKLLEQVERLAQKLGKKLPQKRLDDLRRKINDGTITSNDLPGDIQQEFPPELRGKTLNEIRQLCGKAR